MMSSLTALVVLASLITEAERSNWTRTGRYDEVPRLAAAFERAYPGRVRAFPFGTTPEGRTLVAMAVTHAEALTPEAARARGVPVVLIQGGIHAGEIDGKDAGFLALREMLSGDKLVQDLLTDVTVVFVPVFNADGHERFGPNHRPNQTGPVEMGWRTTAGNLNLNRDYMKADAPEMQAMLRLLNAWDPLVYMDLHVTDGADFQPEIATVVDPVERGGPLARAGRTLRDVLPGLDFYPSFVREDDPKSGFARGVFAPRFSQAYWANRNRIGILVETHSWKDYATRVRATHDAIMRTIHTVRLHGKQWLATAREADDADTRGALSDASVPLVWAAKENSNEIEFPGYAFTRERSTISGQPWVRYDRSRPEVWKVPLREPVLPARTARAPRTAYVVPAGFAAPVAEKLALHGVAFTRLDAPRPAAEVEVYRATSVTFAAAPFEGRTRATVSGAWSPERRDLPAGSLLVPIAQPRARLAVQLLEPEAPDSLCAWGYFNAVFERKEYMEDYVAEQVARDMLARDPALKAEFERRLAADPAFARDPAARLDFFYRRHPSFDERLNLIPVFRVQ